MAWCKFTAKYWDHERSEYVDYNCDSKDEDILDSGLCIFHDENYLQDKNNHKEHEQKVRDRLETKVRNSIDQNEPLFCIGYHLPDIIIKQANFTKPVYFSECEFQGLADFYSATFSAEAHFPKAKFSSEAHFNSANFQGVTDFNKAAFLDRTYFSDRQDLGTFNGEMRFNYTLFEAKEKIIFEVQDLSNVSFMNSDITRIRFSDKARWREEERKKGKDRFTVIEEKWLEESHPRYQFRKCHGSI